MFNPYVSLVVETSKVDHLPSFVDPRRLPLTIGDERWWAPIFQPAMLDDPGVYPSKQLEYAIEIPGF